MTKDLKHMTVGELKNILSGIDDTVEICIFDNLGLITEIEIETYVWDDKTDVYINIDGIYPY